MTIETKTTIQASDVLTVDFECVQCHSITSWPLAVAKHPPTCCHCNPEQQWMTFGGDKYRVITELVALLQQLSKTQNERFILRFGIRNEVSGHASSGED